MSGGSAGRALAFAELGLAKIEDAALAILRQGDPTNARRSDLAPELGKKGAADRYAAFLELAPSLIAREARELEGAPRNARSMLMPRRASLRRSRRACRSIRRRPCSRSAASSPTVARPRFLEALGSARLGPAPMSEPFYITTAISYPNGPPHIGHAYEAIAADAIARFQRQQGRDVRFQTGTDEHGLKMAQAARGEGVEPRAFADKMSRLFQGMCDALNVSYDRFIRTSQPDHYRASQAIWKAMEARGDLYLDRYEGWYSVRDEAYYEVSELTDGEDGAKLSPQGTPVEWTVEESWFFRLSKYQQPLLDHYAAQSRLHPPGKPPQRSGPLRRRRAQGPQHLAHQLRLGRAGAGQRQPRDVRLARRADQLHHRPRLSRRYRAVAPLLAGRRPSDRQGRRALPRGLLAGLPDERPASRCRSRSTATASCSAAARRCRRASATSSIRWCSPSASGSMRCAISCCAKSLSARTAATAPRRSSAAPMPSLPTASAISRSGR